jgi:hypothetical protein
VGRVGPLAQDPAVQDDSGTLMNRRSKPIIRWRNARVRVLATCLGIVASSLAASPAHAHPLRRHFVLDTPDAMGPVWNRFLAGGPDLWASVRAPRFPANLVLLKQGGLPVETPFVDYLIWRRNLNPARFDHYHRNLGPELGLLAPPANTVPTVANPPTGTTPPRVPAPQNGVPEPSTLWIAIATLSACLGRHRRTRVAD